MSQWGQGDHIGAAVVGLILSVIIVALWWCAVKSRCKRLCSSDSNERTTDASGVSYEMGKRYVGADTSPATSYIPPQPSYVPPQASYVPLAGAQHGSSPQAMPLAVSPDKQPLMTSDTPSYPACPSYAPSPVVPPGNQPLMSGNTSSYPAPPPCDPAAVSFAAPTCVPPTQPTGSTAPSYGPYPGAPSYGNPASSGALPPPPTYNESVDNANVNVM